MRETLSFKQLVDREEKTAKLQYLFHTPSALLYLLLENVVDAKEVFDFYDKIDNRLYLLGFFAAKNWREREISSYIESMRHYFSTKREFDPLIYQLLEKVRVKVLFEVFIKPLGEKNGENLFKEVLLWEACIDAFLRGDTETYEEKLQASVRKESLLKACGSFRKPGTP